MSDNVSQGNNNNTFYMALLSLPPLTDSLNHGEIASYLGHHGIVLHSSSSSLVVVELKS